MNLIFPDYFNDNSNNESEGKGEGESNDKQSAKEKEADKSTSNSAVFLYPSSGDLNGNESERLQLDSWRHFYIGGKIY